MLQPLSILPHSSDPVDRCLRMFDWPDILRWYLRCNNDLFRTVRTHCELHLDDNRNRVCIVEVRVNQVDRKCLSNNDHLQGKEIFFVCLKVSEWSLVRSQCKNTFESTILSNIPGPRFREIKGFFESCIDSTLTTKKTPTYLGEKVNRITNYTQMQATD